MTQELLHYGRNSKEVKVSIASTTHGIKHGDMCV